MQTAAGVGGVLFWVGSALGLVLAVGWLFVRLRRNRPRLSCMTVIGGLIMAGMFVLPGFAMGAYVGGRMAEIVGAHISLTCLGAFTGVLISFYLCLSWWRSAAQ